MNTQGKENNSKVNYIIIAIVAIVVIMTVSVILFQQQNPSKSSVNSNSSSSISTTSSISSDSRSVEISNQADAGLITDYSVDQLKKAETGNVILFFNASWCPTCQSTLKDINNNLENIPSDLTILKTDFDKETALKQKYGITMQHTFVKVDKDGNELKKQNGLNTLDNIINFAK